MILGYSLISKPATIEDHKYVMDLKSNLARDLEYQKFWKKFKAIKGDPLIGVWDSKKMKILDDLPSAYDAYPEMIKSLKKEKAEKVTGYYLDYDSIKVYIAYTPNIKKENPQDEEELMHQIAENKARSEGWDVFKREDFLGHLKKVYRV